MPRSRKRRAANEPVCASIACSAAPSWRAVLDGCLALAYFLLFHGPVAQLIHRSGYPPFKWYVYMMPFVAVLVPVAFHMQGLYRLRRGRTRLDDFFAVFVGSILAVVLGVFGTLVVGTYYLPEQLKDAGVYEVSQVGWAVFLVTNVLLTYLSRELVREVFEAGGRPDRPQRVMIEGAGNLGRWSEKVLDIAS